MQNLSLADINPDNYRLYVDKPDKDFSPAKNKSVIQAVLVENDKMQRDINKDVKANAGNVADILTSFAKYKLDLGGGKQLEQWMGKDNLASLYSDKIKAKIELFEIIKAKNRKDKNTKFENFYLT